MLLACVYSLLCCFPHPTRSLSPLSLALLFSLSSGDVVGDVISTLGMAPVHARDGTKLGLHALVKKPVRLHAFAGVAAAAAPSPATSALSSSSAGGSSGAGGAAVVPYTARLGGMGGGGGGYNSSAVSSSYGAAASALSALPLGSSYSRYAPASAAPSFYAVGSGGVAGGIFAAALPTPGMVLRERGVCRAFRQSFNRKNLEYEVRGVY